MITPAAVPRRLYFVRRRKYEGISMLVARDRVFETDPVTDAVWVACNGNSTIAEIARTLAAMRGMSEEVASGMTMNVARFLHGLGLLRFDEEAPEAIRK